MHRQLIGLSLVFGGLLLLLLLLMKRSADAEDVEPWTVSAPASAPAPVAAPVPAAAAAPAFALAPAPTLAPTLASTPRTFKGSLLDVLDESLPVWQACLAEAPGAIADGVITVRFIAAHDETPSPVIETADIDHDESTIESPELRECLRLSALALSFESLPDGVPAIAVGYAVRIENGAVAGSESREFSYLRESTR